MNFSHIIVILFYFVSYTICSKYNVLLIVLDDLRPAVGVYNDGNAVTPNIDRLATSSIVFKNAYAQQALCAPSRNSFLTSRRPDTLHLYDFYNYWRKTVGNFTTLPQHFKNNGYTTHSIGKVFHPGISSNFTDDFPESWSLPPFHPTTEEYKNAQVCLNKSGIYATNIVCPVRIEDGPGGTLPDLESLNAATKFLREINDEPYFLSVGFHKPHIPLKYPRKYLDLHPLDEVILPVFRTKPHNLPNVAYNPWNDMRLRDDIQNLHLEYPFGEIPDDYLKQIIQSYAAAVSYVDDLIGKLLRNVDLKKTVVVLLGDHGVSMGEHGQFSKYSNFDIATRVPLIVHIPKFTQHTVVFEEPVELVDLFPTIVDITAVSKKLKKCNRSQDRVSPQILCTEGKSLYEDVISLRYKSTHVKKVQNYVAISQCPRPGTYPTIKPDSDKPKLKQIKIMGYSIRTMNFRYTEWVGFNPKTIYANWSNTFARELYDHDIDPDENMNLADLPLMGDIIKELRETLLIKLGIA